MWLFLGISAIIFTGFNLICSFKSKNAKWFRFGAISFTALTVCSFYSDEAMRVLNEEKLGRLDGYHANHEQDSVGMCRNIDFIKLCFALSREITTCLSLESHYRKAQPIFVDCALVFLIIRPFGAVLLLYVR